MPWEVGIMVFGQKTRGGTNSCSSHPRMLHHLRDSQPLVDITVQHPPDQIDAVLGERDKRDPERVVEDLVDVVERVLLVDYRVQQDPKRPHILLLASVRFALENFRRSVIWFVLD